MTTSRLIRTIAAMCNSIPLPYARMPVHIGASRMVAQTLDRYVALWLWKSGLLESYESRLMCKLCQPGMNVIDAGANIGRHSLLLSLCVGPQGRVWAFEPDPANFATLQRNLIANKCINVSAVNCAVGAKSERSRLYVSQLNSGDHRLYELPDDKRKAILTEVVALDEFFPADQRIDFVKMDIQGAEGMALEGMKGILTSESPPTLLMEFWPLGLMQAGSAPERVLTDLQAMGLSLEWVDARERRLVKIQRTAEAMPPVTGKRYGSILVRAAQR